MKGEFETALPYASVRGLPPGSLATVSIDRNGKSVSRETIVKFEFRQPEQIKHTNTTWRLKDGKIYKLE